jgi:ADP-heptose:LPS heptosyltransferase
MFEQVFEYLGLQHSKFKFRQTTDTVQDLTKFFSNAKSIMLILPSSYEEAQIAGNAIHPVLRKLNNVDLTILTEGIKSTNLSEFPRSKVIRISASHINRFFLPRQHLIDRINETSYDVVIDLNLDFVLYAAYISRATGSNVRIGFSHPLADIFYNVQINLDRSKPDNGIYDQLAQYLLMF